MGFRFQNSLQSKIDQTTTPNISKRCIISNFPDGLFKLGPLEGMYGYGTVVQCVHNSYKRSKAGEALSLCLKLPTFRKRNRCPLEKDLTNCVKGQEFSNFLLLKNLQVFWARAQGTFVMVPILQRCFPEKELFSDDESAKINEQANNLNNDEVENASEVVSDTYFGDNGEVQGFEHQHVGMEESLNMGDFNEVDVICISRTIDLVKQEFRRHFTDRFQDPGTRRGSLNFPFPNRLNNDQILELESPISNEDIRTAVWGCGVDKSPGPDGFTFEFFRKYWTVVGPDFCIAVKWFFDHGVFAIGCNSSFVALIPKVLDPKVVSDYRPISLIGSLYKVVTKILASRLSLVISDLISDVQTAFLPNRQILDGPFIINEILARCKLKKQHAMC
ncbi:RNA-directed DNA polymerase, eukaryota [Tanacetum coccineum]|uniref:RNA-directed DNA polymerase, eukaryota n=1 Tax=Tanacetum coccineum TaxID=301880 RepID=A0ABQ5IN34_9ASTR